MYNFIFKNQELHLFPSGALYWSDQSILVLSDLHLGKSGHFRKNGIPVPSTVNESNIHVMDNLMNSTEPDTVVFLGDLFHSDYNKEVEVFADWLQKYQDIHFILTTGNHDILSADLYNDLSLKAVNEFKADPFLFRHDYKQTSDTDNEPELYQITGHIHPSVMLSGKGRQNLRLPCFFFKDFYGLLPAFGAFTGTYKLPLKDARSVFAIVSNEVLPIKI